MTWNETWKIVLGIITSLGGIGGIILLVIKFSCNMIAKRLEEKYTLKLNKELEQYKSNLENKTYISKTKFDTEFSIYRELSKAYSEMVKSISKMIPTGVAKYPADEEQKREYDYKLYDNAAQATILSENVLNQNIPFIPSNFVDEYEIILNLCKIQLNIFSRRWDAGVLVTQREKERLSSEDYNRTQEIKDSFNKLNESIREYLSKLDVLD